MEKANWSSLISLLKFPKGSYSDEIVSDASVLSCGCLVSESYFSKISSFSSETSCPCCAQENVKILNEVKPLRDLYQIIQNGNLQGSLKKTRRRSSSRKSIKSHLNEASENANNSNSSVDLMGLLYDIAKSESIDEGPNSVTQSSKAEDADKINPVEVSSPIGSKKSSDIHANEKYESQVVSAISEEKEYNFSKCFPFYRKLTTFQTQQTKLSFSAIANNPFRGTGMIKKNWYYNCMDIQTFVDTIGNREVTRFIMITKKKWEVYEYIEYLDSQKSSARPHLLCCGKSTGEYGPNKESLSEKCEGEIVLRNDFNGGQENVHYSTKDNILQKKLSSWEHIFCKISTNYFVISGTKGIIRVFNLSKSDSASIGQPIYTYETNYHIRCLAIAPNESMIACGITAKERLSQKERPFIILHKLETDPSSHRIKSVSTTTVAIPRRDPIKFIKFSPSSKYLVCCTVWESRCLLIRILNDKLDYLKNPRLLWSDTPFEMNKKENGGNNFEATNDISDYNEQSVDDGITDIEFGLYLSNTIVICASSWTEKKSMIVRLNGASFDTKLMRNRQDSNRFDDDVSFLGSANTIRTEENDSGGDEEVSSTDIILKLPELGTSITRTASSPRGDGMAFLDKEGHLILVSMPNPQQNSVSSIKKIVVLLGEVTGSERSVDSCAIKFSTDGGKLFAIDRKGLFSIFDFTKGAPGTSLDIVKSKIISA